MTVTQTVDIPADRRLTIDVPDEIPTGKTILAFTPVKTFDPQQAREAIKNCAGLAKRMGINLSSDEFLEMRRKDKELEDAKYRRLFSDSGDDN
jgi:hypothetical protein